MFLFVDFHQAWDLSAESSGKGSLLRFDLKRDFGEDVAGVCWRISELVEAAGWTNDRLLADEAR